MSKNYRCVYNRDADDSFIVGKIYTLTDSNIVVGEDGFPWGPHYEGTIKWLENKGWYKFEEVSDMITLNDLKTGMIVQTRNGAYWLVLRDTGCASEHHDGMVQLGDSYTDDFIRLNQFDKNLGCIRGDTYDIMKVVAPNFYPYVNNPVEDMNTGKVLFDRSKIEERKKLTVEEIERLLGYKVAIVDAEGK